jgi:hypothetical protein
MVVMLVVQSKMVGIATEEIAPTLMDVTKSAVINGIMTPLTVKTEILLMETGATLIVQLKMDGIVTFQ